MAAVTLILAAGGLAATTFLVADGSRAEPPQPGIPQVLCRDVATGQVRAATSGHCVPRVQVEIPARGGTS